MRYAREAAIQTWSSKVLAPANCRYIPLIDDASFRKYFRVECNTGNNAVLMDSPPDKEKPAAFIEITKRLLHAGVRVPRIYHADPTRGFLLIEDFGDDLYLDCINPDNADKLYLAAIDMLIRIQSADQRGLAIFDADEMRKEMHLFIDWLLDAHLNMKPDQGTMRIYDDAFEKLIDSALEQPQTFVHRDFHSRNLLVVEDGDTPGVIDYQDAMIGPISYDLVSLLKDCYLVWPRTRIQRWISYFIQQYHSSMNHDLDEKIFLRWLDLMGMQRHFKAIGIFARLYHRDGKHKYLNDVPRTLNYIRDCSSRYCEFSDLNACLGKIPRATLTNQ